MFLYTGTDFVLMKNCICKINGTDVNKRKYTPTQPNKIQ